MATASRDKDSAVELETALRDEFFDFDFFQAVRLLGLLMPERQPVGQFSNPETEVVRFGAAGEFAFPPGEIAELQWPENAQPKMSVNFMGLTGPLGVLPLYYTALVRERLRAKDRALPEFFDIFNHRIISLFYKAWEKYHFTIGYEHGAAARDSHPCHDDRLSPHLLDLIGLGTPGLSNRQAVPDEALLFRSGLLGCQCRSAEGLKALLNDFFDVPAEIQQFVGQWHALDDATQCRFTDHGAESERLGVGTVVGDEIWDLQSGVRVRLGPLTLDQYREFLPEGSAYPLLSALIRFFAGDSLGFEVQLVLRKDETPPCILGADGPGAPRLGWSTWARTASMDHDPDETILRIC